MARQWTLLSAHGIVLFYLASNPDSTMREMSENLGLTERRIAQVVRDLANSGMIVVTKDGRRNTYAVNVGANFRHPTLSHVKLERFVNALAETVSPRKT